MDVEFVSQSSHGHGSLRGRSRLGKVSDSVGVSPPIALAEIDR